MNNYKVLVVEPSNVYQLVIQQLLEENNCNALFTRTAKEALELVDCSSFDLICVAMELQDMSGSELCHKIRQIAGYSQTVPLVMITTNENSATLELALRAGATEIFHKNSLVKFAAFLERQAFKTNHDKHNTGNILYIEDSLSQSSIVIATLSNQGHHINHFQRAEEALEAFEDDSYDLVLTDIILDGPLTGLDIVKAIRKNEEHLSVPILAMSGLSDTQQKLDILRSGANDYIVKPVIQEELIVRSQNLITSKKRLDSLETQQQHLQELAMKDQLTNLFNRHFMMESGPKTVQQAHRHGYPLSMLVIDLDKFKDINDQHGHPTGDSVLESIGATLLNCCRGEDIACRFGGEEFVVLLPHCSLSDAELKAESVRQAIEKSKPAGLLVTASIGVSSLFVGDQEDTIACVFARADHATYLAKDGGRNQVASVSKNPESDADEAPSPNN
ncbi:MAG: diguanylate cyclase [Cycloclasticus sp.]